MTDIGLDAFQFLIAVYLFFTALNGKGTLYNFPDIPKTKQAKVNKNLRILYAVGGFICLLDAVSTMLQHSMYSVEYLETETIITQNYTLNGFPFLSYDMLSIISSFCIIMIIILLLGVIIYTRCQKN